MAANRSFDVLQWLRRCRNSQGCAARYAGAPPAVDPGNDSRIVFVSRGLSKVYHMGEVDVVALRSVDLEIQEGEFIVLLGPSGSGKSTLLNILGGLDAPTGGEAWFRDHNLVGASERLLTQYRREHVGFVFQFYNLIPSLTVRENVTLVTEIADNPMRPEEALSLVGLDQRLDHFPSQLSGGEQQRVAIARAIAKRPDVLLCEAISQFSGNHNALISLQRLSHSKRRHDKRPHGRDGRTAPPSGG